MRTDSKYIIMTIFRMGRKRNLNQPKRARSWVLYWLVDLSGPFLQVTYDVHELDYQIYYSYILRGIIRKGKKAQNI